jgi:DNA-binding response OmpR family regulator
MGRHGDTEILFFALSPCPLVPVSSWQMTTVWVVSANTNERALMVAQLAEEGFDARGLETLSNLFAALAQEPAPHVLVIDAGTTGLDAAKWDAVKQLASASNTLTLEPAGALRPSADAVLRRPFSIGELVGKIESLIK